MRKIIESGRLPVMMLIAAAGFCLLSVIGSDMIAAHRQQEQVAWAEFQQCIDAEPSDAVCDSCWQTIMTSKWK